MRILFMGTPAFSVPILQRLLQDGYDVAAVVTQPDRPQGRKKQRTPSPVKVEAQKHGMDILQPEKIREPGQLAQVLAYEPDVVITAAFGQMLPKALLESPPYGCINVHASLLPQYRGGAPIHHAIMDGKSETGITIMYMADKMDAGPILTQSKVPITETDNVGTLHDKLSAAGAEKLSETLPALKDDKIHSSPQDDAKATFAPNIKREQEKIDWANHGRTIYNQIRGLAPWPGAYTLNGEQVLKIWEAKTERQRTMFTPGTVIDIRTDDFLVQTGDENAVRVQALQPAGKKRMSSTQFLKGAHLKKGDILGSQKERHSS